jgi:hypothetical protein
MEPEKLAEMNYTTQSYEATGAEDSSDTAEAGEQQSEEAAHNGSQAA